MAVRPFKLKIWQQNVNKSPACQHNLISNTSLVNKEISVIALQEPAINFFNFTTAAKDWSVIYPTTHNNTPDKTRTVILI
jgi:hypothetical protein